MVQVSGGTDDHYLVRPGDEVIWWWIASMGPGREFALSCPEVEGSCRGKELLMLSKCRVFGDHAYCRARYVQVLEYYIAAEEVEWDYNPSGRDSCTNTSYTSFQKKFFTSDGKRRYGYLHS